MQTFSKAAIIAVLACSSLSISQAEAFCARCEKIESDREREQAERPKKVGYYEDEISLVTNESSFNLSSPQPAKSRTPQTHSTIETILMSKDLLTTLGGSFTLFIPSDEAFRHLPPGTLAALFRPENKADLSALVGSYIVPTKIIQKDIKNLKVSTLSGKNLDIRVEGETLTVDGIRAIHAQPVADNGMIYILEETLPSSSTGLPRAAQ